MIIIAVMYLLLYILFSSVFSLCIKWVHNRGREDILTIGALNYIIAAVAVAAWFFVDGQQTGDVAAIATGGCMGLVYFIAFFFVIYAIKLVGVSATTVVGVLSITMPIIVAAVAWNSIPNYLQIAGIILALMSLCLMGIKPTGSVVPSDHKPAGRFLVPLVLVFFFALCGMSRICQEAFKYMSVETQKPTYLFSAFVVTAIPSLGMLLYRKKRISPVEWGVGLVMGASNAIQTYFILKSLEHFPGYVVFTVTSAGAILFTTFAATVWLNEKLHRLTYIGIIISVFALMLLNWNPATS